MQTTRPCNYTDLSIDAVVVGVVHQSGSGEDIKFYPAEFGHPFDHQMFCSNCSEQIPLGDDLTDAVKEHCKEDLANERSN